MNFFSTLLLTLPLTGTAKDPVIAKPVALQCEYLLNPIGIDAAKPRLSWSMVDTRQNAKQTAYRILVGKDSVAVSKKKEFHGIPAK
ncbi:hypothetical protein D3C85_1439680 [compost metagenome]